MSVRNTRRPGGVIDWHDLDVVAALPDEMAISAVTAAELGRSEAGTDPVRWSRRAELRLDGLVRVIAI